MIRVGEYFDSGVKRWPGQELILTDARCVLIVDRADPTPQQIDEFETAAAHFAWTDVRYNGILSYRFGAMPWHCIPFNPHRDNPPGAIPGLPATAPHQWLPVPVGLVDLESPVLAVRLVNWPEHFVSAIRSTVERLAAQLYEAEATVNESNSFYLEIGAERLAQRGVRVSEPERRRG